VGSRQCGECANTEGLRIRLQRHDGSGQAPAPLVGYETQEEAEAAAGQVAAAIERAILVQPFAPVT
jgi:hypothetical protein